MRTILATLFLSSTLACANSGEEQSTVTSEPTLTIEVENPSSNPLLIHVTFTMDVDGLCVFDTFSPAAETIANWIVVRPDGQKALYRGPVAKINYCQIVRRLDRGDSVTADVDLRPAAGEQPYFDFSTRGTYQIQLVWSMSPEWADPEYREWFPNCEPWSGTVASNTLDIVINP